MSPLHIRRYLLRIALGASIQASFHKTWKEELATQVLLDITLIRHHFPSYFTVTSLAITRLPPQEIGQLFSAIRCYAVMLSLFLLTSLTPNQTAGYCADLWGYVLDRCPNTLVQELDMVELAVLLEVMIEDSYGARGSAGRETMLRDFLPVKVDHIAGKGAWGNNTITRRITFAIVLAHRPLFRERISEAKYFAVGRGFRREELVRDKALPLFEVGATSEDDDDMEEAELEPMGEAVPLVEFCEPVTVVPEGEACSVCMHGFGVEEKDAVMTKCTHFFHQGCLNEWVNESCMGTSNACPTCRAEMCRERERRLVADVGLERLSQDGEETRSEMQ